MILMVEGKDRLILGPSGQLSLIVEFHVSNRLHINKKQTEKKKNQKTHHQQNKTRLRHKRWLSG